MAIDSLQQLGIHSFIFIMHKQLLKHELLPLSFNYLKHVLSRLVMQVMARIY